MRQDTMLQWVKCMNTADATNPEPRPAAGRRNPKTVKV